MWQNIKCVRYEKYITQYEIYFEPLKEFKCCLINVCYNSKKIICYYHSDDVTFEYWDIRKAVRTLYSVMFFYMERVDHVSNYYWRTKCVQTQMKFKARKNLKINITPLYTSNIHTYWQETYLRMYADQCFSFNLIYWVTIY